MTPEVRAAKKKKRAEDANKQRLIRRQQMRDYEKVICKKCKEEIRQHVSVVFDVPLGWQDFSKDGLFSKFVKVLGPQWEGADWSCGCGVKPPVTKDTRIKARRGRIIPKGTERG